MGMIIGYGMAFGNGKFVCSGSKGCIFASNDGQTWTKFTTDVDGTWNDVIYNDEMFDLLVKTGAETPQKQENATL